MSCSQTPCAECHAGCCRAFAVPITGADILRLERAGHDFWEFVCRWQDDEGQISRNYAPQIHFADEPQTPFVLCLLQNESKSYPGTGKCRFLGESQELAASGRPISACTVYNERPAACRAFPFRFDEARETVQLQPTYDPPAARRHDAYKLCPRPWSASDVDGLDAAQSLAVAEYEMTFFKKVVALWNRAPGPWDALPKFLRLVYQSRVNVEQPAEEPVILRFPGRENAEANQAADKQDRAA